MFEIDGIPNTDIIWRYAVRCVFKHSPQINLFDVVFPKQGSQKLFAGICIQILRMKSTDLANRCFKISWWITLTRIKPLLLNSSLQKRRIPALAFNCSYASSVKRKTRNPLTVCGFHLNLRIPFAEFRTTSYIQQQMCRQNLRYSYLYAKSKKNFVSGIHLHFLSCIKISFWNLRTYRNKTVRLSSA